MEQVQAALAKVEDEIEALGAKLVAVEADVTFARARNDLVEVAELRKEKEHLRKEKEQLRTKEEQLRAEKLLLLQSSSSSAPAPAPELPPQSEQGMPASRRGALSLMQVAPLAQVAFLARRHLSKRSPTGTRCPLTSATR
jgi:multidrug resistance efflux pump